MSIVSLQELHGQVPAADGLAAATRAECPRVVVGRDLDARSSSTAIITATDYTRGDSG